MKTEPSTLLGAFDDWINHRVEGIQPLERHQNLLLSTWLSTSLKSNFWLPSMLKDDLPQWKPNNFLEEEALKIEIAEKEEQKKAFNEMFWDSRELSTLYHSTGRLHVEAAVHQFEIKYDQPEQSIKSGISSKTNQRRPILSKHLERRITQKATQRMHKY